MVKRIQLVLLLMALSISAVMAQRPKNTSVLPRVTDIWVVFKTHFDLGFTDLPENVFKRYREEMMTNALSIIEKNALLPKEKRFSWTVSGWPLQAQILGPLQPSERKAQIGQAIKTGALVVHGLPFTTHTESLDYEDLVRGLGYSSMITRNYGLSMTISAKMTDVPAHSWILPTLLHHAGIKFLQLGCNPASQYPRFPELFWWEGPDGSKVLCNYTALYGSDIRPPENWPCKNYLAMQMTGDNHGPPTSQEIDNLLAYAAREMPGVRIHFGTLDDFAKAVLAEHPVLPTVKGDCPDTWIHGIQSNPQETRIARNIRPLESALDALHTQMGSWGIPTASISGELAKAYEQSLLYGEHTWGMNAEYGPRYSYGDDWRKWMAASAAEPLPPNGDYTLLKNSDAHNTSIGSKRKWLHSYDEKRRYILNTRDIVYNRLNQDLHLLASSVKKTGKRIVIYNPLPWKRSGMIENPWQKGSYYFVKDVPPSGYVTWSPEAQDSPRISHDRQPVLNTPSFQVTFDLTRGGISSLIEKPTGRQLGDTTAAYVIGQFLHERFSTHEVDNWFNAYSRIKDGWGLNDLGKPGMIDATKAPYLAFTPKAWDIDVAHTAAADIATLSATDPEGHAENYTLTFTFPRDAAYVDVTWSVTNKTPDKQPEGGWLCFPFNVQQPTFTMGRPGGPVDPSKDIIPGCNRYLMAINSGVAITSPDKSGMALSSADAPLVSPGEPGLWKYSMDYIPRQPALFVNLYNNMWNTNFALWQEGTWTESVRIWPVARGTSTTENLVKYAWETRVPLLTATAEGAPGILPETQQGIAISRPGVLVTAFGDNPDGDGTILRLWEQAGISGNCTVNFNDQQKIKAVLPLDLRGNKKGAPIAVKKGSFVFRLDRYSPASFLLIYEKPKK
ncbi:hypothetical protein HF329_10045 [Chitinophaga oryzae]|uniref:Glycoside hydrolase family 38 N-terminal domain-containing protein n=1 Tax=Chitinophaga oryzae TaxID=2725414 RepID=A0AAE6ZF46_9BACT|nr:hypothetical protein [Chitinophaga oryzae]QJB31633.1 hypothetical protein HF329_10045 [Chitinophaga oryzae]